jgi:hypothetical protein
MAGDRWVTEGIAPPPSVHLAEAPDGEVDPVYGRETGIARDDDGNARGGIRLPDVEIGRGQFIAADFDAHSAGLFGGVIDLQCTLLSHGKPRFPTHGAYVSRFVAVVNRLVADGFLLPKDANHLRRQAAHSDVGKPHICD